MGLQGMVLGRANQSLTDFTARPHRYSGGVDSSAETKVANTGGSIASGYRMLMRNTTLAGADASNYFTGQSETKTSSSRLSMVSRLRKKRSL